MLCPDTDLAAAQQLADDIIRRARDCVWPDEAPLTFSAGVAVSRPNETDPDHVIHRADTAMYLAKTTRDTVRTA